MKVPGYVSVDDRRALPARIPGLKLDADLGGVSVIHLEAPRTADQPILLVGSTGDETLVIGLEPRDGARRFTTRLPPGQGARRAVWARAAFAADDAILVAATPGEGVEVRVARLARDGRILHVDRFERPALAPDLWPGSAASIEHLGPLECEDYVLGWFEEDDGQFGVGLTRRSGGEARWVLRGSAAARVGDLVIGHREVRLDVIARQRPLVARRIDDGAEVWARVPVGHEHEGVVAGLGGLVLANDERRRLAGLPRGTGGLPADHEARVVPSLLTALDAATGATRWTREIDGYLPSVLGTPSLVAAVASTRAGSGAIHCFDRVGTPCGVIPVDGQPDPNPWGASSRERWPSLIDCDGERILWSRGGELVCDAIQGPERHGWRLALPSVVGERPALARGADVLCVAGQGRVLAFEQGAAGSRR